MTRLELIMEIKDELKGTCALPYSVNSKEIERIIDQAKRWFYREYRQAVESKYFVIPKEHFQKAEFKNNMQIQMPDCVVSIYECKEITGGTMMGFMDRDFTDNKLIAAEMMLSAVDSDRMVMSVAQMSFWDLSRAFILEHVSYDYNRNTQRLTIKGRTPRRNLFLRTYIEIPEEDLFEDWLFIRYCTAMAKKSLGRILGFFEYNLPGGVSINYDAIKSEGEDELEQIIEQIREEDPPDWFMIMH